MDYTLEKIAALVQGKIEGHAANVTVNKLARIEDAEKGTITFLANPKYLNFIYTTKASAVIVEDSFVVEKSITPVLIKVKNAYDAFTVLTKFFSKDKQLKCGISEKATIEPGASLGKEICIGDYSYIGTRAKIGNNVQVYPHVYIGDNVVIGDNTVIFPGVKVYDETEIGKNCKIHAGTVIGSDGFGFAPQSNNEYSKIEQLGNVVIEDNVEIGANTTIDRAAIGSTIIRKGVKLDNLIQIAHNVEIGENTVIAAQTGISGSAKIGRNCMIGGQVGIVGHLTIADNVKIAAQSGIQSSITKVGAIYQGSPAFEVAEYRKAYVCFKKLPEYFHLFYKLKDNLKD